MTYLCFSLRVRGTVIATLEFLSSFLVVVLSCTALTKFTSFLKKETTNEVEINTKRWAPIIYAVDGTIAIIGILELISVMTLFYGIAKPSLRWMRVWLISKSITTVVSIIVQVLILALFYTSVAFKVYLVLEAFRDFYFIWFISSHVDEVQLSHTVRPIRPTPQPIDTNTREGSTH